MNDVKHGFFIFDVRFVKILIFDVRFKSMKRLQKTGNPRVVGLLHSFIEKLAVSES